MEIGSGLLRFSPHRNELIKKWHLLINFGRSKSTPFTRERSQFGPTAPAMMAALSFFWFRRYGTRAFLGLLGLLGFCVRSTYLRRLKLGDDHNAWNWLLNHIHNDGFDHRSYGLRHCALRLSLGHPFSWCRPGTRAFRCLPSHGFGRLACLTARRRLSPACCRSLFPCRHDRRLFWWSARNEHRYFSIGRPS
jgi:hypothetical protein